MWISLISILSCLYLTTAKTCVTPLGQTSKCVPVYECTEIIDEVKSGGLNKQIIDFLDQSHCGWQSGNPKICCGPLPASNNVVAISRNVDVNSLDDTVLPPSGECGRDFINNNRSLVHRIIGGTETELGEFPWLALLWYRALTDGELKYNCGGMLVNRLYVVTAAHCLTGVAVRNFGELVSVTLGEHDVRNETDCIDGKCSLPPQNIRVLSSHPHENYVQSSSQNDIGLIKLSERVNYNQFVQPICLDQSGRWEIGDEIIVAGWGRTLTRSSSSEKLKVSLAIANQSSCSQLFASKNVRLTSSQLCIGGEFRADSCKGDSGGPAMRLKDGKWEAIAVVSFGNGCGRDGWPGVYTAIYNYHDWITKTMRETGGL